MAYHEMGCIGLESVLAAGFEVPLVVTHADDPKEERWFRSVSAIAGAAGVPVLVLDDPNNEEHIARIAGAKPDVLFSFYFRKMISPRILELAKDGAFNLHGSLLPKYRGRAPINWVLVNGESETGVTLHVMDAKPDHGDIVGQARVAIERDDTALTLSRKCGTAAKQVLDAALPLIRERRAPRQVQDHSRSSYFGGRKPDDGRIVWSWPAERVRNLVRAVTKPWPGAFTAARGRKMIVWSVSVATGGGGPAGTLVPAAGGLAIQTGEGLVLPGDVEVQGSATVRWADAVRDLELGPGDRLGEETA